MIESRITEFKREYTDNLKFTAIAFANTEGGKVYIGINDDAWARHLNPLMLTEAN